MTITADAPAIPAIYIQSFDQFVGQERAKQQLSVMIQSSIARNKPMKHILLASGLEGLGKTNLAMLIAAARGVPMIMLDPTAGPGEALYEIECLEPNSIVFCDEAHRGAEGGKNKMDWWLPFLQGGVITGASGVPIKMPDVTVIFATTDEGKLNKAMLSRFIKVTLTRYSDEEANKISLTTACRVLDKTMPDPTLANCAAVARAASNNPRVMGNLWSAVVDYYHAMPEVIFNPEGGYDLTIVLDSFGYTHDGLTEQAVQYLIMMATSFKEGAGQKMIADALHEPGGVAHTELMLHEKGLIEFTRRGRCLTTEGRHRARKLTLGI